MKQIFAIDPGTTESGFCVVDYDTMKPVKFGKVRNTDLMDIIHDICFGTPPDNLVFCIEMIAGYGQAVGREVFETCVWIGRFRQTVEDFYVFPVRYVYRKDVKLALCGSMKANDANIRRALIDKYAKHDLRSGKGTRNNPDWFYGFKKDIWQSYAVAETWKEMEGERWI